MRISRHWREYAALLSYLCIMLSVVRKSPADEEDLLSLARAGHRAARQAIHTFSATISSETASLGQPKLLSTGKYWRSFDIARLQETVGSGTEDSLLKDSEIRQVGQGTDFKTGQKHYGAFRKAATEFFGTLDAWNQMMIEFGGPNGGHYDLDHFLEFAKEPPRARRERKDGRDCIRITFSVVSSMGVEQKLTLWHDIERNYLVRKMIMAVEESHYKGESEILEFVEPLPGLFFPTRCHSQRFRGSELIGTTDVTLSDLQINKPIPKSVFQLPAIPAGTELLDRIQGTRYPIDENWQAIGPARPFVITRVPAKSDGPASEYHSQSKTEARSVSWWLVSGSLVMLAVAFIYRIYRNFRSRPGLNRVH